MTFSTPRGFRLVALVALAALLGLAPTATAQTARAVQIAAPPAVAASQSASSTAVTALSEDFEDADVTYTTSVPEFSDSSSDFFTRTDGSNISSSYEVTGFGGTSYFAAQDLDGEVDSPTQSIYFSDIDVDGLTDLTVSFRLAEDDSGDGNEDWDGPDYVRVYAFLHGSAASRQRGGEVLVFAVESDPGTGDVVDETNTEPRVDTNFDGLGDGAAITSEFADFMASIPGTGERLTLRIEISLDSGDEDIAIDDVMVTGTSEEVEPVACTVGSGLSFTEAGVFDADGLPDGEKLSIYNFSPVPAATGGCSISIFDPFTEQVTYSVNLFDEVIAGTAEFISGLTYGPFPNVIPDGPGAVVLVEGSVAAGASVADVLPNLVSGMVYQSETEILHVYSSYLAAGSSKDDFLAALARLSQPVANEDGANGIDLAVTAAPNPLRDRSTVAFGVAEAADVRVAVYDALGREVALLAEAPYAAGRHEVTFEANDLPAGVYVIRAVVGSEARTARVTLAR